MRALTWLKSCCGRVGENITSLLNFVITPDDNFATSGFSNGVIGDP
jgi:hypothetical protein